MVNFPTRIPDCDSHSLALLDLFLSSDTSICSTKVSAPLGNSDNIVVSISIDFTSYSQWDAPFHREPHLRDVPWEDIFKLSASAAASEFYDAYIPHQKYQVKPHSSPWFSDACAAAIVHRNHFFCLYQNDKSSESKIKVQAG